MQSQQHKDVVKNLTTASQLESELQLSQAQHGVTVLDVYNAEWGQSKCLAETFRRLFTDAGDLVHLRFFSVECNAVLESLDKPEEGRPALRQKGMDYSPETLPAHWSPILRQRQRHSKPYFVMYKEGKMRGHLEGIDTPRLCKMIHELCKPQYAASEYLTNANLLQFWETHLSAGDSEATVGDFMRAVRNVMNGTDALSPPITEKESAVVVETVRNGEGIVPAAALQSAVGETDTIASWITTLVLTHREATAVEAAEEEAAAAAATPASPSYEEQEERNEEEEAPAAASPSPDAAAEASPPLEEREPEASEAKADEEAEGEAEDGAVDEEREAPPPEAVEEGNEEEPVAAEAGEVEESASPAEEAEELGSGVPAAEASPEKENEEEDQDNEEEEKNDEEEEKDNVDEEGKENEEEEAAAEAETEAVEHVEHAEHAEHSATAEEPLDEVHAAEVVTDSVNVTADAEDSAVNQIFTNRWVTVTEEEMRVWNTVAALPLHYPGSDALMLLQDSEEVAEEVARAIPSAEEFPTLRDYVHDQGVSAMDVNIMCLAADQKVGSESLSYGKLALILMSCDYEGSNSLVPRGEDFLSELSQGKLLAGHPALGFTALSLCASVAYPDECFYYCLPAGQESVVDTYTPGSTVVLAALAPLRTGPPTDGSVAICVVGLPKVIELATTDESEETMVLNQWYARLQFTDEDVSGVRKATFQENVRDSDFQAFADRYVARLIEDESQLDKKTGDAGSEEEEEEEAEEEESAEYEEDPNAEL